MCSVARDGRAMPSTSNTVAVVESPRWGERPTAGRGRSWGFALRIYSSEASF